MSAARTRRQKPVSFKVSAEDARLIKDIIARAVALREARERDLCTRLGDVDWVDVEMSLVACHANGTPLNLAALLEAERTADFTHDVWGIHANISTKTGELLNFFHPRFARSEHA